ncbi:MAG: hypothetical protein HPY45_00650 [Anaerolineae bacterium]|nr:hypothetical protein [Anaerolineae bacterium]
MAVRAYCLCILIVSGWLFLSSCVGVPSTTELSPPDVWRVAVVSPLRWMTPYMNTCVLKQPHTAIVLVEPPSSVQCLSLADVCFSWGEEQHLTASVFDLGKDDLVFVVHSESPVNSLTQDELNRLYSGRVRVWQELGTNAQGKIGEVVVWAAAPETEMRRLADALIGGVLFADTGIAPGAAAMRQAVAENPQALGYLPRRWLDASLKPVRIPDAQDVDLSLPILAAVRSEPQGKMRDWLLCLQEAVISEK